MAITLITEPTPTTGVIAITGATATTESITESITAPTGETTVTAITRETAKQQ